MTQVQKHKNPNQSGNIGLKAQIVTIRLVEYIKPLKIQIVIKTD